VARRTWNTIPARRLRFGSCSKAQKIDDRREGSDPFKLPKQLRADVDLGAASLADTDLATGSTKGDMKEASGAKRRELIELERQLRGGYHFIKGIDEGTAITEDQRNRLFETYGWSGGEIGAFNDERTVSMARIAISVGATEIPQAEWRYTQGRLDRIILQLGIVTDHAESASGGDREKATKLRNAAMETAKKTLARVRFYYCSASRDVDQTPELAKLDFQPRRLPGKVEKKPATNQAATPATAGAKA
jgi:hypothetical protein